MGDQGDCLGQGKQVFMDQPQHQRQQGFYPGDARLGLYKRRAFRVGFVRLMVRTDRGDGAVHQTGA
jgi:hypothetical protein